MRKNPPADVFLQHGTSRGPIHLARTPRFLRFVIQGTDWLSLDALDQMEDTPAPDETVIVAELVSRGNIHIDGADKRGRRTASWVSTATYKQVHNPPPREVAADTQQWQAWCYQRAKCPPAYTPPQPKGEK